MQNRKKCVHKRLRLFEGGGGEIRSERLGGHGAESLRCLPFFLLLFDLEAIIEVMRRNREGGGGWLLLKISFYSRINTEGLVHEEGSLQN